MVSCLYNKQKASVEEAREFEVKTSGCRPCSVWLYGVSKPDPTTGTDGRTVLSAGEGGSQLRTGRLQTTSTPALVTMYLMARLGFTVLLFALLVQHALVRTSFINYKYILITRQCS